MLVGWRFRIGCFLLFPFVIVFFLLYRPVVFFLLHRPVIFFCVLSPSQRIQLIYSSWRVCECMRAPCYPRDSLTPRTWVLCIGEGDWARPNHLHFAASVQEAFYSTAWHPASIRCSLLFFSSFRSSSMTCLAKPVTTLHAFSDASICRTRFSGVIAVTSVFFELSSLCVKSRTCEEHMLCVLLGYLKN